MSSYHISEVTKPCLLMEQCYWDTVEEKLELHGGNNVIAVFVPY